MIRSSIMELINRELSMKEKAEAYDRALEIAKAWHKLDNNDLSNTDLETLFPELKESENEKIRKDIIFYIKAIANNENISPDSKKECKTWIAWLEKQGEQKSTGKNESKFEVGDWVVNKLGNIWHIDSFDGKNYQVTTTKGEHNYFPVNLQDRMHLWTIQDSKDGDILAEDTCIFIIKKLNNDLSAKIYCCLYDDGDFDNLTSNLAFDDRCTYPATAEQRDILFKGMEGAGYEWDSEKKELKRTEPEPTDEPKFKVSDWITNERYAKLIVGINSDWPYYMFEDGTSERIKDIDKKYHLWTIKDAKPGDVLVDKDNNIGIYKEIEDTWWNSYIYLGCNNCLYGPDIGGMHGQNSTKPAIKERRDLLFSKMKEAGYEWDPGKKELKKIEQEPTDKIRPKFKVGDRIIKSSRKSCPVNSSTDDTICEVAEVHDTCYILNTGEGRIQVPLEWQDQYELVNPSWGEEDEKMFRNLNSLIYVVRDSDCDSKEKLKLSVWLKSLKERRSWSPSDEQIVVLELASKYERVFTSKQIDILIDLKNQLKKLKGE